MVEAKKSIQSKLKRVLNILGPGLITGASDDDPSGIATYSQAGAQFGLATLWTALITFPLMATIQEMCARIGIVTSKGLTSNIRNNYPKPVLYLMILFTFPAVILNIGANIAGMGAAANLIFPSLPVYFFYNRVYGYADDTHHLFTLQKNSCDLKISLCIPLVIHHCSFSFKARLGRNCKTYVPSNYQIQQRVYRYSCCHSWNNHFALSFFLAGYDGS